ncbi:Spy/CpxP family protein refolding chaperone [Uruburuella testudinis]|uniref:Spy/CpxP family protein refolding chaperone n=1 Tax=Uruburuella testudinis TaxID=1282863 RepID=A0ABY4DVN3_9NEIS|nr:Spy/CpxP family protein refolding chaperone [Uruburuella testudinis]UOO83087.1 Spy/CpxP family protein refolding chaperone [Uruburuella testudinis]
MKPNRLTRLLAATALCAGFSAATQASPLTSRLDDFHPNCDIRKLSLTKEQHTEMRIIRDEYKKTLDSAAKKTDRTSRQRRREIVKILSEEPFNHENARNYISGRYLASIDFAVEEMQVQHRIYQLLTPGQRRQWLNACLK